MSNLCWLTDAQMERLRQFSMPVGMPRARAASHGQPMPVPHARGDDQRPVLARVFSTVSCSREAVQLERNRPKVRLIDGEQFVEMMLQSYTRLAPRYRSLIPFKQIYVHDLPKQ